MTVSAMSVEKQGVPVTGPDGVKTIDVAIVGAGVAGLYATYKYRAQGFAVAAFEAGSDVGGTWYWNRYPGARIDVESAEYSYTFSDELRREWRWSERYASQAELHEYLKFVAQRLELRPHITFDTRVERILYNAGRAEWTLYSDTGPLCRARFCVMATGFLSAPNMPNIEGIGDFGGDVYHTSYWPKTPVDLTGKRVGVIGTGSSGVQLIPKVAEQAGTLTVFQRTANFCIPLRNRPLTDDYRQYQDGTFGAWKDISTRSFGAFHYVNFELSEPNPRSALEVSEAERLAEYEFRWNSGGLCYFTSFRDLMFDAGANESLANFVREKVREKVKDPETREALVPRDHPIMAKRLCGDTNYYETFNQPHVTLVDVRKNPIDRIAATGVVAGGREYPLDVLIFATGFDAGTGAMTRMDIQGRDGRTIKDHFSDGPRNVLGMMAAGFPNMFIVDGPGSPGAFYNPILLSELQIDWFGRCMDYMRDNGIRTIEATAAAEEEWVSHSRAICDSSLFSKAKSWYVGVNIEGRRMGPQLYMGGIVEYSRRLTDAEAGGYAIFAKSH